MLSIVPIFLVDEAHFAVPRDLRCFTCSIALLALVFLEVLLRHILFSVLNSPALTEFSEKGKLMSQSYNTSSLSGDPSFFQRFWVLSPSFGKGPGGWVPCLFHSLEVKHHDLVQIQVKWGIWGWGFTGLWGVWAMSHAASIGQETPVQFRSQTLEK